MVECDSFEALTNLEVLASRFDLRRVVSKMSKWNVGLFTRLQLCHDYIGCFFCDNSLDNLCRLGMVPISGFLPPAGNDEAITTGINVKNTNIHTLSKAEVVLGILDSGLAHLS